ncbi:hypothetical protein [Yersinia kristensenii]|uniref:hypothetical protein n=1 Tax=Yersinia kristensenii TaxID=28152 RepID=UPI0005E94B6A|nr:hypothetical protein [Yersinia kristensenii]CND77765.1 Uncharacterised protein [Yersinia kristensenii]
MFLFFFAESIQKEDHSQLITLISSALTLAAVLVAVWQIYCSRYESRRASAFNMYSGYLSLAMEYPLLAFGEENVINNDKKLKEIYPWFISNMLFTFEQILKISKNAPDWKSTIHSQLMQHSWYLAKSSTVQRREYEEELMSEIDKILTP